MQRFLILIACVGGCTLFGLRCAERLKGRTAALRGIYAGIHALTSAAAHTNRPLYRIADDIYRRGGLDFWHILTERLLSGEDAGKAWCMALETAAERGGQLSALKEADRAMLTSFAATLGKTGRASQAEDGRQTLNSLAAQIAEAEGMYAQKGRIYRTLGLFLGLGLGILLW